MIISLIIAVFSFLPILSFAQTQGMIIYEMSDDAETGKDNSIDNVKIEVAYSGDISQMKVLIGAGIEFSWLVREKGMATVRFATRIDTQKLVVEDYPLDSILQVKNGDNRIDFSYVKGAGKKILKYKCKKAVLKSNTEHPIEMFVTSKIKHRISIFDKLFKGVKGIPLEFTLTTSSGRKMTFQAKWIYEKITTTVFKLSNDYRRISYEAFRKKMGNVGFAL